MIRTVATQPFPDQKAGHLRIAQTGSGISKAGVP